MTARMHTWKSSAADSRWAAWAASVQEVYLVWGAKRIVRLAEELKAWKHSCDVYVTRYNDSLTPVVEHTVLVMCKAGLKA